MGESWAVESSAPDTLFNSFFRLTSRKNQFPTLPALCDGNSQLTHGFSLQWASKCGKYCHVILSSRSLLSQPFWSEQRHINYMKTPSCWCLYIWQMSQSQRDYHSLHTANLAHQIGGSLLGLTIKNWFNSLRPGCNTSHFNKRTQYSIISFLSIFYITFGT